MNVPLLARLVVYFNQVIKLNLEMSSGGAKLQGFFDDVVAEAKANKVDLKARGKEETEKDWDDFQKFVSSVEEEEEKQNISDEKEQEEQDAREALEQMQYLDRYRQVLDTVEEKKPVVETRLTQLLLEKKRKRSNIIESDDFNPLNWRNKSL